MMLLILVCFAAFAVRDISGLDSINTNEPIVREAPSSLDQDSYFGFSAVLHRVTANPQNFAGYLASTRIVVSAPNGTAENSQVDNTGVLYTCTISKGDDRVCSPLLGNEGGNDRYLHDTTGNNGDEDKSKQFLGVAMDSVDNMFTVCAHRYFYVPTASRYPRGKCFYTTNRELEDFEEYAPCEGRSTSRTNFGQCMAGTSAVIADLDTESDSTILPLVVGSPGSREWRGTVFRRRPNNNDETDLTGRDEETAAYAWQGYAMTKGHFISTTRQDIAVSVPRLNNYFGQINIIRNNNGLDYDGQTLIGTAQMGEYFGFSLAAADLNGDGFDELLVGAPMYSPTGAPEAGQVYLYKNNQGNLEFFRQLTAPMLQDYTRFGHSITNLGDINGDGLEDIAIGAPFGSGSGKVYVYHGSVADTITRVQQTITGSEVTDALVSVETPKGFGYSLSSSLDVDGNGINDLLIGSYASQQVFLLRSHAVATVPVTISSSPSIVNLTLTNCMLNEMNYACFTLTACATFPTGSSFSDGIELTFMFFVDRQNIELGLEQRAFFGNAAMSANQTVTRQLNQGQQTCLDEIVYINNGINDRLNGFPVELSISSPELTPASSDGNPDPTDLTSFPIVVTSGQSMVQVETLKDCEGQLCIPNLQLSFKNITYEASNGSNPTSFVAGEVTNFNIWMTLYNRGEDAFLTSVSFTILTAQFEFIRILPRNLLITCTSEVGNERTVLTCPIANPLKDRETRVIAVRLRPTTGLRPSQGPFSFTFTATSLNDELNSTLSDNSFTEEVNVAESADIFLDKAVADPEQLSYTANISASNVTSPEDLGPPVTVSYVIRNSGPSTVPETRVRIFWPFRAPDSEFYYLYPSQIQRSVSNSIDCMEEDINPLGLSIQSVGDVNDMEGGEDISNTGKRRRRRSISPLKRKKRSIVKRQELEAVDEVTDIVINCRTNPELCREITCTIRQLAGGSSVQLDIVAHLDERYFQSLTDRFTFIPYGNISIVAGSSNIQQPLNHMSDETEVQIRAVTSVPPPRRRDSSVAPWIIIVPIVLGVLFFVILGVILYFVGFFRLKSKQKKEELAAQILESQQGGDTFDEPGGAPAAADPA